ncbi:MAG: ubiquinol-cytochrome C chaperone family protein [Methyloceanibacter sp.]
MAQARLPGLYQAYGLPDTLEGRFAAVSLHLFAVLDRLKAEGAYARDLAQALTDRFSEDMEVVLREIGVSDLRIPKKMRALAASSAALLETYEKAFAAGEGAFVAAIAESLPLEGDAEMHTAARLAAYLSDVMRALRTQAIAEIEAGRLRCPEIRA